MKIYTKSGDGGTTAVFGGKRLLKSALQVEACGTLDELTSFIGLVTNKVGNKNEAEFLGNIQLNIYKIIASLAGAKSDLQKINQEIEKIEQYINKIQSRLTKLNCFILPQGDELSSWFHVLRTVCRRAERTVVKYFEKNGKHIINQKFDIIKYLNRLSDLFFVLSRYNNKRADLKVQSTQ